jgi:hypothetical protein
MLSMRVGSPEYEITDAHGAYKGPAGRVMIGL